MRKEISKNLLPQDKLDKKDLMILRLLQKNSKLTHKEIAEETHLGSTAVFDRIKRLEKLNFIKGYPTQLDINKLDLEVGMILTIQLHSFQQEKLDAFHKYIQEIPEIITCYQVLGKVDFILTIYTKDLNAYHELLTNKIRKQENIKNIHTHTIFKIYKETTSLPI